MCNPLHGHGSHRDGCEHLISIIIVASLLISVFSPIATMADPDPCLVVYPDVPCVYHYDVTEYYTVGPGHPLYDPVYDRGGAVLLEVGTDEIDESIYQAPYLTGFEPSVDGNDGYVFTGTYFGIIIDGFSNEPTTYENILVVFDQFAPSSCAPHITVEGVPLEVYVYAAGNLAVMTPTPGGNNYSDTMILDIGWWGCYGVHIWAFADENHNGILDGGECFTAYSHDAMVPAEEKTWGWIKSIRQ